MNLTVIIIGVSLWYLWFFLGASIKEFFVKLPEVTKEEIREAYTEQAWEMADLVRKNPEIDGKEEDEIISSFVEAHMQLTKELEDNPEGEVRKFNKRHKRTLFKLRLRELLSSFLDMAVTLIPAIVRLLGFNFLSSLLFIALGVAYMEMFSGQIEGEIGWTHRLSMVTAYMVTQVPYYTVLVLQTNW